MRESQTPEAQAARAASQKVYKKNKRKRAKAKKQEMKTTNNEERPPVVVMENNNKSTAHPIMMWKRVMDNSKATDRPVEEDKIKELLEKRSNAKAEKNYTVSDEIAERMIDLDIVYDDAKKQWYSRELSTEAQKQKRAKKKRESKASSDEPAAKKTKQ